MVIQLVEAAQRRPALGNLVGIDTPRGRNVAGQEHGHGQTCGSTEEITTLHTIDNRWSVVRLAGRTQYRRWDFQWLRDISQDHHVLRGAAGAAFQAGDHRLGIPRALGELVLVHPAALRIKRMRNS